MWAFLLVVLYVGGSYEGFVVSDTAWTTQRACQRAMMKIVQQEQQKEHVQTVHFSTCYPKGE